MEWELPVSYKLKQYKLKAVLEYHSNQIMRIRVHGANSTLLLENNYPLLNATNSKKALNWKLKEGSMKEGNAETSQLLYNIMSQLEDFIKRDFKEL